MGPCLSCDTHLIKLSNTSKAYASRHKLFPFQQYVNLTHSDNYMHGPFDVVTFHGCKSCNPVDSADWTILQSHTEMFHDFILLVEVATYSVHIDTCTHTTTFNDSSLLGDVSLLSDSETECKQLYP
jgi:hypothetical protein